MKVVCDGCRAKYQIPDERVAGKKLKIRCRRCAGMIILRGDLMQPEAQGGQIVPEPTASLVPPAAVVPERPSMAPAADTEWHAISGDNQIGPFSTDEIAELLSAGQLTWDDYVWHEGLGDWITAAQADVLIQTVQAMQGSAAASDDDSPTRMFSQGSAQSAPPGAYASPSPAVAYTSQPPVAAQAGYNSQPPTAYSSGDAGLSFGGQPEPTPISSPRVGHDVAMTGGRHEDSVLFSASNLATYSDPAPQPEADGYASGDASGLIDIRALASIAAQSSVPPARATGPAQPLGDDLMKLAQQTGAFNTLDSLAPVSSGPRKSSNALPLAILAGSGIVAAAAFAAVYLTRVPPEPTSTGGVTVSAAAAATPVSPEPEALAPVAEAPAAPAEAAAAEAPVANEAEEAVPAEAAEPPPAVTPVKRVAPASKKVKRSAKASRRAAARAKPSAAAAAKTEAPEPAKDPGPSVDDLLLGDPKKADKPEAVATTEEPKAKEPPKDRSIDDLLNTAVDDAKKNGSKKRSTSAAASALPESPDRRQVLGAMRGVQGAVKACADGAGAAGSTAKVAVTVAGSSGRVTSARVTGVEGPVASCIAKAVRDAKFPKFSKPDFSINYPFRL